MRKKNQDKGLDKYSRLMSIVIGILIVFLIASNFVFPYFLSKDERKINNDWETGTEVVSLNTVISMGGEIKSYSKAFNANKFEVIVIESYSFTSLTVLSNNAVYQLPASMSGSVLVVKLDEGHNDIRINVASKHETVVLPSVIQREYSAYYFKSLMMSFPSFLILLISVVSLFVYVFIQQSRNISKQVIRVPYLLFLLLIAVSSYNLMIGRFMKVVIPFEIINNLQAFFILGTLVFSILSILYQFSKEITFRVSSLISLSVLFLFVLFGGLYYASSGIYIQYGTSVVFLVIAGLIVLIYHSKEKTEIRKITLALLAVVDILIIINIKYFWYCTYFQYIYIFIAWLYCLTWFWFELKKANNQFQMNRAEHLAIEMQTHYIHDAYSSIQTYVMNIQTIHDKMFQVIASLNSDSQDFAYSNELIQQSLETEKKIQRRYYSENMLINSVLNQYVTLCERKGIHLEINAACNQTLNMDDEDFTSLMGNLLDNAIEACLGSDALKPTIKLSLRVNGDLLLMSCDNDCAPSRVLPGFMTTKTNRLSHGYGIKLMQSIATKYQGLSAFKNDGKKFSVKISLKVLTLAPGSQDTAQ